MIADLYTGRDDRRRGGSAIGHVSPCVLVWLSQVRGKRSWQWWQKNVIAPIILVGLGALYSACLMLDRVEERFVIFRSYITLNDASNRKVSDVSDVGL